MNGKLIAVIVSGYDGDGAAALCGLRNIWAMCATEQIQPPRLTSILN
jgi:hypothetical protein